MFQWLRVHLAMQGMLVRSPGLGSGKIPHGAEQLSQWNATTEAWGPTLHCYEEPSHCNWRLAPLAARRESPLCSKEDPRQPKNKDKEVLKNKNNLNTVHGTEGTMYKPPPWPKLRKTKSWTADSRGQVTLYHSLPLVTVGRSWGWIFRCGLEDRLSNWENVPPVHSGITPFHSSLP